ncbi:hypothetical protein FOPE_10050 [Fonsecaea pedrosoi]|nr:hypothetical protein FOPE_10050 [Fonsecaea pedrosoi]
MSTTRFEVLQGNKPISFRRLMALKRVDDNVFESLTPAWPPAPFRRAFGGHVYAQAMYAASKTVEPGLVVHLEFDVVGSRFLLLTALVSLREW